MPFALIFLISIVAGFVGAMSGMGGGVVLIPALTFLGLAFIGTRVLVRLTNQTVRRFFQVILAVLGIEMIVRGIRGV